MPEPFRASIAPSLPPSKWSAPVTPPASVIGAESDNLFYARSPPPPRASVTHTLSAQPPPPQYRFGSETLSTVVLPSPLSAASTSSPHNRYVSLYIHSLAAHIFFSSLNRSQSLAAATGKLSEHSLSPLHGSASHASSFAYPAVQPTSGTPSSSSRQYLNYPSHSPTSTVSSFINQHTVTAASSPALGRSLPSTASQTLSGTTSRLPIRPVGPPPSQQLLSPSGSIGDGTLFQSLVQV